MIRLLGSTTHYSDGFEAITPEENRKTNDIASLTRSEEIREHYKNKFFTLMETGGFID
jgi:hypothetical protein